MCMLWCIFVLLVISMMCVFLCILVLVSRWVISFGLMLVGLFRIMVSCGRDGVFMGKFLG